MALEIIVLTGLPGSGKSTFARKNFPSYKRINLDTLKSRSREEKEIIAALQESESVIVDNTNTTINARKRYIEIATRFQIPIRSIYLECPTEIAIERNRARRGKEHVPDFVIKMYNRKLEQPSLNEGFSHCEVIDARSFPS